MTRPTNTYAFPVPPTKRNDEFPVLTKAPFPVPDWSYHPSGALTKQRGTIPRLIKMQALLESFLTAERAKTPPSANKVVERANQKMFERAHMAELMQLSALRKTIQDIFDAGEQEYRRHYRNIFIHTGRHNNHEMPYFIAHLRDELATPTALRRQILQDLWLNRRDPSRNADKVQRKQTLREANERIRFLRDMMGDAEFLYEIRNRPDYNVMMEVESRFTPRHDKRTADCTEQTDGTYDDVFLDDESLEDGAMIKTGSVLRPLWDFVEPIAIPLHAGIEATRKTAGKTLVQGYRKSKGFLAANINALKTHIATGYKAAERGFLKTLLEPKKLLIPATVMGAAVIGVTALMGQQLGSKTTAVDAATAGGGEKNIYVTIAESWNKVKGDVLSSAAEKSPQQKTGAAQQDKYSSRIVDIVPQLAKLKALENMKQTTETVAESAIAVTDPSAEESTAKVPKAKSNFKRSVKAQDYAKPAVRVPNVTVAGVTMNFDAATHKGACTFLARQGLSSWLCQQPS